MVSLQTAENALKEIYLAVLSNQLDMASSPVLAKIKQSSKDVWGKEIRTIPNWNTNYDDYPVLVVNVEDMSGNIEISDKLIRVSQNSTGAFVNLLNEEMENLLRVTTKALSDAFFTEDKEFIDVNGQKLNNHRRINTSGLKELFSDSPKLYGLERSKYCELNPVIKTIKEFNIDDIQSIINNYNDQVNFMICHPNTKRKYQEKSKNQIIEIKEMGLFKCLLFNQSIPIVTIREIPENEIYFINTNDFTLHQLCDWKWLCDINGNILRQRTGKPIYNATVVKYGNYICENPYKQIKIVLEES